MRGQDHAHLRRLIAAIEQALRIVILSGRKCLLERRHAVACERNQESRSEWFPPGRCVLRIQEAIELGIHLRAAGEALARQQQVPIQVDVGLVDAPPPCEAERIQRVHQHAAYRWWSRSPLLEQAALDCRAEEPFHAVDPARDDERACGIDRGHDCDIDRQLFAVWPPRQYRMGFDIAAGSRGRPAKALARSEVVWRKPGIPDRTHLLSILVEGNGCAICHSSRAPCHNAMARYRSNTGRHARFECVRDRDRRVQRNPVDSLGGLQHVGIAVSAGGWSGCQLTSSRLSGEPSGIVSVN